MENAADALKMAGAAALFVIAFTVAMTMFTRARQTTDAVLDNLRIDEFYSKVEPLDNNITREVGLETVIPTLYRYAQSDANIRIRILTSDGTEHQVFDQNLDKEVSDAASITEGAANDTPYYKEIRRKYNKDGELAYLFQAPWRDQSDSNDTYKVERINAYIYGTEMQHMKEVSYNNSSKNGNSGLLAMVEAAKTANIDKKVLFQESYIEYNISGTVEKDEYDEEIVTRPPSTKIIITYKLIIKD